MNYVKLAMALLVVGLTVTGMVRAEVPHLINYQGILASPDGEPLDGNYLLTFSVYPDTLPSAPLLWMERHEDVLVSNGLFNLILGTQNQIPLDLFEEEERWLGIAVDTDLEIYPRMRITAVPYALRAAVADSVLGSSAEVDGDWVIAGNDMYSAVSGNVGIGTVAPAKKLQIGDNGVPNSEGMIRLESRSGTQGSNRVWDIGVPETDGDSSGFGYSFVIDDTQAGTNPEFMVKFGTGHVGIGTFAPGAPLHVHKPLESTAEASLIVSTRYTAGMLTLLSEMQLHKTSINCYSLLGDAAINLNNESAGNVHLAVGGGEVGIGTTNPAARLDVAGDARMDELTVAGAVNAATLVVAGAAECEILHILGADVAEKFPVSEVLQPGLVVAIDPDRPGQLCLARGAYNRRVAGVVSGAGDLPVGAVLGNLPGSEASVPVALTGRVWVWCDATDLPIAPGDLLTTADTPGHAMAVTDHARAQGAVLGKAMSELATGRDLVLVLVNLQ